MACICSLIYFMYPGYRSTFYSLKQHCWAFSKTGRIFFDDRLQFKDFGLLVIFDLTMLTFALRPTLVPLPLLLIPFSYFPCMLIEQSRTKTTKCHLIPFTQVTVFNHKVLLLCQNHKQLNSYWKFSKSYLRSCHLLQSSYFQHMRDSFVVVRFAFVIQEWMSKLEVLPIFFDCQCIVIQYLFFDKRVDQEFWFKRKEDIFAVCVDTLSENERWLIKSLQ